AVVSAAAERALERFTDTRGRFFWHLVKGHAGEAAKIQDAASYAREAAPILFDLARGAPVLQSLLALREILTILNQADLISILENVVRRIPAVYTELYARDMDALLLRLADAENLAAPDDAILTSPIHTKHAVGFYAVRDGSNVEDVLEKLHRQAFGKVGPLLATQRDGIVVPFIGSFYVVQEATLANKRIKLIVRRLSEREIEERFGLVRLKDKSGDPYRFHAYSLQDVVGRLSMFPGGYGWVELRADGAIEEPVRNLLDIFRPIMTDEKLGWQDGRFEVKGAGTVELRSVHNVFDTTNGQAITIMETRHSEPPANLDFTLVDSDGQTVITRDFKVFLKMPGAISGNNFQPYFHSPTGLEEADQSERESQSYPRVVQHGVSMPNHAYFHWSFRDAKVAGNRSYGITMRLAKSETAAMRLRELLHEYELRGDQSTLARWRARGVLYERLQSCFYHMGLNLHGMNQSGLYLFPNGDLVDNSYEDTYGGIVRNVYGRGVDGLMQAQPAYDMVLNNYSWNGDLADLGEYVPGPATNEFAERYLLHFMARIVRDLHQMGLLTSDEAQGEKSCELLASYMRGLRQFPEDSSLLRGSKIKFPKPEMFKLVNDSGYGDDGAHYNVFRMDVSDSSVAAAFFQSGSTRTEQVGQRRIPSTVSMSLRSGTVPTRIDKAFHDARVEFMAWKALAENQPKTILEDYQELEKILDKHWALTWPEGLSEDSVEAQFGELFLALQKTLMEHGYWVFYGGRKISVQQAIDEFNRFVELIHQPDYRLNLGHFAEATGTQSDEQLTCVNSVPNNWHRLFPDFDPKLELLAALSAEALKHNVFEGAVMPQTEWTGQGIAFAVVPSTPQYKYSSYHTKPGGIHYYSLKLSQGLMADESYVVVDLAAPLESPVCYGLDPGNMLLGSVLNRGPCLLFPPQLQSTSGAAPVTLFAVMPRAEFLRRAQQAGLSLPNVAAPRDLRRAKAVQLIVRESIADLEAFMAKRKELPHNHSAHASYFLNLLRLTGIGATSFSWDQIISQGAEMSRMPYAAQSADLQRYQVVAAALERTGQEIADELLTAHLDITEDAIAAQIREGRFRSRLIRAIDAVFFDVWHESPPADGFHDLSSIVTETSPVRVVHHAYDRKNGDVYTVEFKIQFLDQEIKAADVNTKIGMTVAALVYDNPPYYSNQSSVSLSNLRVVRKEPSGHFTVRGELSLLPDSIKTIPEWGKKPVKQPAKTYPFVHDVPFQIQLVFPPMIQNGGTQRGLLKTIVLAPAEDREQLKGKTVVRFIDPPKPDSARPRYPVEVTGFDPDVLRGAQRLTPVRRVRLTVKFKTKVRDDQIRIVLRCRDTNLPDAEKTVLASGPAGGKNHLHVLQAVIPDGVNQYSVDVFDGAQWHTGVRTIQVQETRSEVRQEKRRFADRAKWLDQDQDAKFARSEARKKKDGRRQQKSRSGQKGQGGIKSPRPKTAETGTGSVYSRRLAIAAGGAAMIGGLVWVFWPRGRSVEEDVSAIPAASESPRPALIMQLPKPDQLDPADPQAKLKAVRVAMLRTLSWMQRQEGFPDRDILASFAAEAVRPAIEMNPPVQGITFQKQTRSKIAREIPPGKPVRMMRLSSVALTFFVFSEFLRFAETEGREGLNPRLIAFFYGSEAPVSPSWFIREDPTSVAEPDLPTIATYDLSSARLQGKVQSHLQLYDGPGETVALNPDLEHVFMINSDEAYRIFLAIQELNSWDFFADSVLPTLYREARGFKVYTKFPRHNEASLASVQEFMRKIDSALPVDPKRWDRDTLLRLVRENQTAIEDLAVFYLAGETDEFLYEAKIRHTLQDRGVYGVREAARGLYGKLTLLDRSTADTLISVWKRDYKENTAGQTVEEVIPAQLQHFVPIALPQFVRETQSGHRESESQRSEVRRPGSPVEEKLAEARRLVEAGNVDAAFAKAHEIGYPDEQPETQEVYNGPARRFIQALLPADGTAITDSDLIRAARYMETDGKIREAPYQFDDLRAIISYVRDGYCETDRDHPFNLAKLGGPWDFISALERVAGRSGVTDARTGQFIEGLKKTWSELDREHQQSLSYDQFYSIEVQENPGSGERLPVLTHRGVEFRLSVEGVAKALEREFYLLSLSDHEADRNYLNNLLAPLSKVLLGREVSPETLRAADRAALENEIAGKLAEYTREHPEAVYLTGNLFEYKAWGTWENRIGIGP
ncbi:MAG: hypothetical protein PHN49_09650, partial [Candidatus Omnitrophica bacterium]|nr:hypothetical protein [Candidatus Omnitrophota bacterium]